MALLTRAVNIRPPPPIAGERIESGGMAGHPTFDPRSCAMIPTTSDRHPPGHPSVPARTLGTRRALPHGLTVAAAGALSALAACAPDRLPGGADLLGPRAAAGVRTSVAPAAAATDGFDPADSYAQYETATRRRYTTTAHVAAYGAERVRVPASTITRPLERTRVEVGYDLRGRPRVVLTPLADPAAAGLRDGERVGRVVVADGDVEVYGTDGRRLDTQAWQGLAP